MKFKKMSLSLLTSSLMLPTFAAETTAIDTGDTAWVIVASAMVLLMTPGLAFFYGGMVRTKNVVSTLFQSFVAVAVVGLLWAVCGYSLSFSGNNWGGIIGDLNWSFLNGVGQNANADYAATIPHSLFMLFQCMFAIITPALMTGAFAERVKFSGWITFLVAWSLLVYAPIAHSVWAVGGFLRNLGALDFAGGLVVHMSAGFSALVAASLIGKRKGYNNLQAKPYDAGMVLLGTALLWFGWFGFNAGSALGSNGLAVQAFGTTLFASCAAMISWMCVEYLLKGKASSIGAATGAVAGLVAVTPASGFVTFSSAMVIGLCTGAICNYSIYYLKEKARLFDDTLDVFGCHGIGGTLGVIFTGIFATKTVNSAGADGLYYAGTQLFTANVISAGAVLAYSVVTTYVLYKVVNAITTIRVTETDEEVGLDESQHGEVINSNITNTQNYNTHTTKKVA